MTVYEKLLEEFGCAINAILGDVADKEWENSSEDVSREDIIAMSKKVCFYLDK